MSIFALMFQYEQEKLKLLPDEVSAQLSSFFSQLTQEFANLTEQMFKDFSKSEQCQLLRFAYKYQKPFQNKLKAFDPSAYQTMVVTSRADMNTGNPYAHDLVEKNNLLELEKLIAKHADMTLLDKDGKSALDVAVDKQRFEIAVALLRTEQVIPVTPDFILLLIPMLLSQPQDGVLGLKCLERIEPYAEVLQQCIKLDSTIVGLFKAVSLANAKNPREVFFLQSLEEIFNRLVTEHDRYSALITELAEANAWGMNSEGRTLKQVLEENGVAKRYVESAAIAKIAGYDQSLMADIKSGGLHLVFTRPPAQSSLECMSLVLYYYYLNIVTPESELELKVFLKVLKVIAVWLEKEVEIGRAHV